ncbi:hypothetical protein [Rhodococcoides fascians]|uniref:hypothetical protein n=1 Tax=Rhodococcoides fascians TaxID=1828 RepID=UPI000A96063C|nr:hypothetical protein [Rhodococcus fascians]
MDKRRFEALSALLHMNCSVWRFSVITAGLNRIHGSMPMHRAVQTHRAGGAREPIDV